MIEQVRAKKETAKKWGTNRTNRINTKSQLGNVKSDSNKECPNKGFRVFERRSIFCKEKKILIIIRDKCI